MAYVTLNPSVSPAQAGTVDPQNPVTVRASHGDTVSQTFVTCPNQGYFFKHWLVDGAVAGYDATYRLDYYVPNDSDRTVEVVAVYSGSPEPHDSPLPNDSSCTVRTSVSPAGAGTATPSSRTLYGVPPDSVTFDLVATANPGYGFDRWTDSGGSTVSTNAEKTVRLYFKSPAGTSNVREYVAHFILRPIYVRVYVNGSLAASKTARYGDQRCGEFSVMASIPDNSTFDGWTGSDTIGGSYSCADSLYKFWVDLTGFVPSPGNDTVHVYLETRTSPDPWPPRPYPPEDPDPPDDPGDKPNPDDPRPWVRVIAHPDPADGSRGTVSPLSQTKHGGWGDMLSFDFTATIVPGNKIVRWYDSYGNTLGRSADVTVRYQVSSQGGYEVHIYAKFEPVPPRENVLGVLFSIGGEDFTADPPLEFGGLGTLSVDGDTIAKTDSAFPFVYKLVRLSYDIDSDGNPVFSSDPLYTPEAVCTPANGYYLWRWRAIWHYDGVSDYIPGAVSGQWFDIGTDGRLGGIAIPAQLIYSLGETEDNYRTILHIAAVPQPMLRIDVSPFGRNGWTSSADPVSGTFHMPGTTAGLEISAWRTSGNLLAQYIALSGHEELPGGGVSWNYFATERFFSDCRGRVKRIGLKKYIQVPVLPLGNYTNIWRYAYSVGISLVAETGRVEFNDETGIPIFRSDNGNVIADY